MSLGATIREGVAWMFLGNVGNQIVGFVFGVALARLLVPEDFGMLVTIQVFTGLAGYVAGGGMGQALVRAREATKQDYDIVFTLQLIVGVLIYMVFFFAAPFFAIWYHTPLYSDLLRVSALSFIFRPFVNLPSSLLQRAMRFKAQTVVRLTALLLTNTVSITMALKGYGVWSLIFGGIAGSIANMCLLMPLAKWRPGFSLQLRRGRNIARYGFLASITDVLGYLQNQASIFILSGTLGPTSVGLYNKGESVAQMPQYFVTHSVYAVLFRAVAAEQENLDKCRYLFFRSVGLVSVYVTPFYVGFIWLAEPLVRGVYGPKWVEAAIPLSILAFASPFWVMNNLSGAVLAARNWLDREIPIQASTAIIASLAILIGLPYGIKGVALAIAGTSIYSAVYMHAIARQCLGSNWSSYFRALIPAFVLNTILGSALWLIDSFLYATVRTNDLAYVLVMGVAGGGVYALCFLYLPLSALKSEQTRWKTLIRLQR